MYKKQNGNGWVSQHSASSPFISAFDIIAVLQSSVAVFHCTSFNIATQFIFLGSILSWKGMLSDGANKPVNYN